MRITSQTVADRRRPNEFGRIEGRGFPGQYIYADPNRLEREMHQLWTRPIGMHPGGRVESTLDYFEPQRRRKENAQCLIGIAPKIPWPFMDRKSEVGRMKSQAANFQNLVDLGCDHPRHREMFEDREGKNRIKIGREKLG